MRALAVLVLASLTAPSVAYSLWRLPFKLAPAREAQLAAVRSATRLRLRAQRSCGRTGLFLSQTDSANDNSRNSISALREAIALREEGLITEEVCFSCLFWSRFACIGCTAGRASV
jgi:hypothetical protein